MTPEQRQMVEGLAAIMAVSPSDEDRAYAVSITASLAALDAAEQERDQARQARADEAREYGLAASARRGLLYELRQRAEQAEAKLAALTAPPAPPRQACPHGDPACPCQDGDPCHYEDTVDTQAMAPPAPHAEAVRVLEEVRADIMGARRFVATVPMAAQGELAAFDACAEAIDAKLAALRAEGEGGPK